MKSRTILLLLFLVFHSVGADYKSSNLIEIGAYVEIGRAYTVGAVWVNSDKLLTKCSLVMDAYEEIGSQHVKAHLYIEPSEGYDIESVLCSELFERKVGLLDGVGKYFLLYDMAILKTKNKFTPSFYLQRSFILESRDDWQVKRLDEDLEEILNEHEQNLDGCQILFLPSEFGIKVSQFRPVVLNCTLLPIKPCLEKFKNHKSEYKNINYYLKNQLENVRCFQMEELMRCPSQEGVVVIDGKIWGLLYTCGYKLGAYKSFDRTLSFIYENALRTSSLGVLSKSIGFNTSPWPNEAVKVFSGFIETGHADCECK